MIDQSFVRDMRADRANLSIAKAVMGLAAGFHRPMIAEGLKTAAHGGGCQWTQGCGIARPMPADDLPGWVARWRPAPCWTIRARPAASVA